MRVDHPEDRPRRAARHRPAVRPLLALLVALAGGAGARAQDGPPDPAARHGEFAYLARKWREAQADFQREQYDAVVARCTSLLDLEPELPWRDEVRDLRVRANERRQAADVLGAELLPEAPRVAIGEPIRLRVRLTARATDPVEWRLGLPDEDAAPRAMLEVRVREHGAGRVEGFHAFRVPVTGLPDEAVLPRGDVLEAIVELPTGTLAPLRVTPRTYTIVGAIRPASLIAGERRVFNRVLVPTTTVEVWPRGAEALAAHALAALQEALREELPVRCFLAAFAAPAADRPALAEALLESLGAGFERRAMRGAVFGALRRVTGADLPDDDAAWFAWWTRQRAEAAAAAATAAAPAPEGGR